MAVPIAWVWFVFVKFSTYTSSKDTSLSLQSLIEYCETKKKIVIIFRSIVCDLKGSMQAILYV